MKIYVIISILAINLYACNVTRNPGHRDIRTLRSANWETRHIDPAITWRHSAFASLFDTIENINILDIDLSDPAIHPSVLFQDSLLSPTHEIAEKENALVAVNGNF